MNPAAKDIARLRSAGWFDSQWYASTYTDVGLTGLDPAYHYLTYGTKMQRDPGPDFPVRFFTEVFSLKAQYEPSIRFKELLARTGTAKPAVKKVLRCANEVGLRGRYELALKLAQTYLSDDLRYSANIIKANCAAAVGDEPLWLESTNTYLSHFGLEPLVMNDGYKLFDRLSAKTAKLISSGPKVSILVPAFNAESTIEMAIRSLLAQTWANIEVIVVDDCSTDGTWSAIQRLATSDTRIVSFRNEINVGPYVSKNIALSQAKGDWITGHDADDWAHPERIERQVAFIHKIQKPASMSGMLRMASDGSFVKLNNIGGFVHDGACRSGLISLMVSAQYFRDVLGSWDSVRVGGDSELIRRIERLENKKIPELPVVTMLCYDNPDGLTNDAVLGYSGENGVSPYRIQYRDRYTEAHAMLQKTTSRLDFPIKARKFEAPEEMLNEPSAVEVLASAYRIQGVSLRKSITADIAIVTNYCFAGGNASSTLDEIEYFLRQGFNPVLIHCPIDSFLGKPLSDRFAKWIDRIVNWTDIERLDAKVVICRHPRVLTSSAFKQVRQKISANHLFAVINNSTTLSNGTPAYDLTEAVENARRVDAGSLSFCPVSSTIRDELVRYQNDAKEDLGISEALWNPTFDLKLYEKSPNLRFSKPFCVGRHGRDGIEKWCEDPASLLQIYPENHDFEVAILGGATNAKLILGKLPANWTVYEFGTMDPGAYLSKLDAFVYFPNSHLEEAFGRTIVEAMLATVPVILPKKFERTFGDLAFYCEPAEVQSIIWQISKENSDERISYLSEVQKIAANRYSSDAISARLQATGLKFVDQPASGLAILSDRASLFRLKIQDLVRVSR